MAQTTSTAVPVTTDSQENGPKAGLVKAEKGRFKAEIAQSLPASGTGAYYAMDKILRAAGAERVDEAASKKLHSILLDNVDDLVFRAKILARHAGRSKINAADIRLAAAQNE